MHGSFMVWAGADGMVIGLIGDGTSRASATLEHFVIKSLDNGAARIEVDLSQCKGLDSTFLGCLVRLYQRGGDRFGIVKPSEAVSKVLKITQLERVLPLSNAALDHSEATGTELQQDANDDPIKLGQHILDCHRALLAIEGPHQPACEAVVRNLAAGLGLAE